MDNVYRMEGIERLSKERTIIPLEVMGRVIDGRPRNTHQFVQVCHLQLGLLKQSLLELFAPQC